MTVLADLARWWRHRNDPPAMLPDPVRWTFPRGEMLPGESADQVVERLNQFEDHTANGGDRWHLMEAEWIGGEWRPVLRRTDGRYRWRDDGFRGF